MELDEDLILWSGSVRTKSIAQRLEAATAGEFSSISLFPTDIPDHHMEEQGDELLTPQKKNCIEVLEPFCRWLPEEYWSPPEGLSNEDIAWLSTTEKQFFEIAELLDVNKIALIEPFGQNPPLPVAIRSFEACCDRAATYNIDVMLEFVATSGIRTLKDAWQIVKGANRANGGLLIDTWHFVRSGSDMELLRAIPGEKIHAVQLADGVEEFDWPLVEDALHHRKLPCKGAFPITGILDTLREIEALSSLGPEIFSDEFHELPPQIAGSRAGRATRAALRTAD